MRVFFLLFFWFHIPIPDLPSLLGRRFTYPQGNVGWRKSSLLKVKKENLLATGGTDSPQGLPSKWAGRKAARGDPLWEALGGPHITSFTSYSSNAN